MLPIQVKEITTNDEVRIYAVEIVEHDATHLYTVEVPIDAYERLTSGAISYEDLVTRSFRFLLERESPRAILSEFVLTDISTYFSEYEDTLRTQISQLS